MNSEIKINQVNAVALGGFNPMILTPDFMAKYCLFEPPDEPVGKTTPVVTEIRYGNIHLLMELNKFQIKLVEAKSFEDKTSFELMLNYLSVLKYTPLKLFGVNLNFSLPIACVDRIGSLFESPLNIGKALDISPVSVLVGARNKNSEGLFVNEATINYLLDGDIKNNIKIEIMENEVLVNNNFEIGDLDEDRDRIQILESRYGELLEKNDWLLKTLGVA